MIFALDVYIMYTLGHYQLRESPLLFLVGQEHLFSNASEAPEAFIKCFSVS